MGDEDKEATEAIAIEEIVDQPKEDTQEDLKRPERKGWKRDLRIDGKKLRDEIQAHGMSCREVSRKLGKTDSFVSTNCCDGCFASEDFYAICDMIGVNPAEFIWKSDTGKIEWREPEELTVLNKLSAINATLQELVDILSGFPVMKEAIEARIKREDDLSVVDEEPECGQSTEPPFIPSLEIRIADDTADVSKPEWAKKPTYEEFSAYCAKLNSEIDVDKQWKRLEDRDWDAFDWKRSINGVHSGILRKRKKMIPSAAEEVVDYFVACGMQRNVAIKEARRFIEYYEKRGWFPNGYPNNKWLPANGWKTYAAKWARNHFEWKGETA